MCGRTCDRGWRRSKAAISPDLHRCPPGAKVTPSARRLGVMGGLFISVRFVRHGASFPAWPQGQLDGRLTKPVTGGGRSPGRGQTRLVRGAGAAAAAANTAVTHVRLREGSNTRITRTKRHSPAHVGTPAKMASQAPDRPIAGKAGCGAASGRGSRAGDRPSVNRQVGCSVPLEYAGSAPAERHDRRPAQTSSRTLNMSVQVHRRTHPSSLR